MIDEQKIIDKIKKLLELASSPNENESRLAMEKAQKLMIQFNLDDVKIGTQYAVAEPIISESYWNDIINRSGVIETIPRIVNTIGPIFGVFGLYDIRRKTGTIQRIRLYGFKTNLEITKFALDSLLHQGLMDYRIEFKKYRSAVFGLEFWSGFGIGIERKFTSYGNRSENSALVIYDRVQEHIKELADSTFNLQVFDGNAIQSGINAGLRAEIRKGLETQNQGKLIS